MHIHLVPDLHVALEHFFQYKGRQAASQVTDLFDQPKIHFLVTNAGTSRWLQQQIALKEGVFVDQPVDFLGAYLWDLIAQSDRQFADKSPFEPNVSVWAILDWLEGLSDSEFSAGSACAPLAGSLVGATSLARYRLAHSIASIFDRYLLYRLDWLQQWQTGRLQGLGEHEPWQLRLWQFLLIRLPKVQEKHPFFWLRDCLAQLPSPICLPETLVVFGADDVPALHWQALEWLSAKTQVLVYSRVVCDEFHQDLQTDKALWRNQLKQLRQLNSSDSAATGQLNIDHSLLASWGKAQALQQVYISERRAQFSESSVSEFIALVEQSSCLSSLQLSIASADPKALDDIRLQPADTSIRFFDAVSLARQVEHLEIELLNTFAKNPELKPGDVVVFTTDPSATCVLIDATWTRIPYRCFGDQNQSNSWLAGILAWLQAVKQLPSVQDGLDLLNYPHLRARFAGISVRAVASNGFDDVLKLWQQWLKDAGVKNLSTQASDPHSWVRGFERIMLGFAVSESAHGSMDRWPVQGLDEDNLSRLENLCLWIERLQALHRESVKPRKMADWCNWLTALVHEFTIEDGDADQVQGAATLLTAIASLANSHRKSSAEQLLYFDVVLASVEAMIESGTSVVTPLGAVMVMPPDAQRHVSHKLIVWLGMDDDQWPRSRGRSRIDLLLTYPRAGDPNERESDKGLFLESLMSAREQFWIFYRGRSVRTGENLNPSALVVELMNAFPQVLATKVPLVAVRSEVPFTDRIEDWAIRSDFADVADVAEVTEVTDSANAADLAQPINTSSRPNIERFLIHPARYYAQQILGLRQTWLDDPIDAGLPWNLTDRAERSLQRLDKQTRPRLDHPLLGPGLVNQAQIQIVDFETQARLLSLQKVKEQAQSKGTKLIEIEEPTARYLVPLLVTYLVEDLTPPLIFCHKDLKTYVLAPLTRMQALALLEALDRSIAQCRQAPPLLFAKLWFAWLTGVDEKKFAAIFGSTEEADQYKSTDSNEAWNQLVWRGLWPSFTQAVEHLQTQWLEFRGLIRLSGAKSAGAEDDS